MGTRPVDLFNSNKSIIEITKIISSISLFSMLSVIRIANALLVYFSVEYFYYLDYNYDKRWDKKIHPGQRVPLKSVGLQLLD